VADGRIPSKKQQEFDLVRLEGQFTLRDILSAHDLGSDDTISVEQKIQTLFLTLADPLLSAFDIALLLHMQSKSEFDQIRSALLELEADGFLESDSRTSRPLMPKGDDPYELETLYRQRDIEMSPLVLTSIETEIKMRDESVERVYQFSCDARLIRQIAKIERFDVFLGEGNQRAEIKTHILNIKESIEATGSQIPNSILLVLDPEKTIHSADRVLEAGDEPPLEKCFVSRDDSNLLVTYNPQHDDTAPVQSIAPARIRIPYRNAMFDREKTLNIADGQQRTAAIALTSIDKVPQYMITVNAILPSTVDREKQIFVLANTVRPVRKDLVSSIIGTLDDSATNEKAVVPWVTRQLTTQETNSPFYLIVKVAGTVSTSPNQVVSFATVEESVRMIHKRLINAVNVDSPALLALCLKLFSLYKQTWPEAWGRKPVESKLMAGIGMRALTRYMSSILLNEGVKPGGLKSQEPWTNVANKLKTMRDYCVCWTEDAAAASGSLHSEFFRREVRPRTLVFQDIQQLADALEEAANGVWRPK
jgi:DGQHR domain-containing protein